MLEIYPNAPLRDAMARGKWSVAPDDDAAEMYLSGLDAAGRGRLRAVPDLQRRRPGRESRHNLKYWTDGEWLGFGCGAHSTRDGVRWKNIVVDRGVHLGRRRRRTRWRPSAVSCPAEERLEEALFRAPADRGLDLRA